MHQSERRGTEREKGKGYKQQGSHGRAKQGDFFLASFCMGVELYCGAETSNEGPRTSSRDIWLTARGCHGEARPACNRILSHLRRNFTLRFSSLVPSCLFTLSKGTERGKGGESHGRQG